MENEYQKGQKVKEREIMKLSFSKKQTELLKEMGIPFDVGKDLSDDEICEIEEYAGDYLVLNCLDEDYKPNQDGVICYEILDMIGEL